MENKQTASEILQKHEDDNEMHFHDVDRKFIIEAMEEYAEQQVKAVVQYYNGEPITKTNNEQLNTSTTNTPNTN
jgi:predicted ATP-grasp superfamily ATP-dependent carboligase